MVYGSAEPPSHAPIPAVDEKVAFLLAHKRKVICLWVAALAFALPFGPKFLASTSLEVNPPVGSPSYIAEMKIRDSFKSAATRHQELILISCTECTSMLGGVAANTTRRLEAVFARLNDTNPGIIRAWSTAVPVPGGLQVPGFIAATSTDDPLASLLVSPNQKVIGFQSQWDAPLESHSLMDMLAVLRAELKELNEEIQPLGYNVLATGSLMMLKDTVDAMTHDSMSKEIFMTPLAILVLLYHVRSWRLCLVTFGSIVLAASAAMATLYPLTKLTKFSCLGPSVMAALCLALSVDYALFLLTRFRAELAEGKEVEESLSASMVNSGSVIVLSGCILALCCSCCMLFPGSEINSLALAALGSIIFAAIASMTFTPCMIATFPDFFTTGLPRGGEAGGGIVASFEARSYFMMGSWLTRYPNSLLVPLGIMSAMLVGAWQATHMKFSNDVNLILPRGSNTAKAYHLMADSFPVGFTRPVQMHLGGLDSVASDEFFDEACSTFRRLVDTTKGTPHQVNPKDLNNVVTMPSLFTDMAPGMCPPFVCLRWSGPPPDCPFLPGAADLLAGKGNPLVARFSSVYRSAWAQQVSPDNKSTLAYIVPTFDPSGENAMPWSDSLRGLDTGRLGASYYSLEMMDRDTREADYKRMPLVVGLTVFIMAVLMSAFFGMAFLPVKLFVTILIPIAFVYGFQVMVQQYGWLSFLPVAAFQPTGGISWATPITSITVLLGLAVDYEIFLFSRVVEFRQRGYDNRASVVGALAATGPTITGAGLIMAIAFFGMLLSSVAMNWHMGFLLCSGVLIDTFIVRSLLVPPVLMVGDFLNYWPRKMPEPMLGMADLEDLFSGVDTISKKLMSP